VAVWAVPDGKRECTVAGHWADLSALAFSTDAKWLATAGDDECVGLWDSVGGARKGWLAGWKGQVASLAFARAGERELLVVADADSLGLFAVPDLTPVARLPGKSLGAKESEVEAAGASADGKLVAVSVGDGRVNVFDAEDLAKVGLAVPDDPVRQEMPSTGRTGSRRRA
jgi:WD40 repeat protein